MSDFQLVFILGGLLCVFLYPVLNFVLFIKMRPLRARALDLGESLLENKEITNKDARLIYSLMNDLYDWKSALYFMISLPYWCLLRSRGRGTVNSLAQYSTETRDDFNRFIGLFLVSIMAACPLAAFVIIFEIAVVSISLLVIGRLQKIGSIQLNALWQREYVQHRH